MQTAGQDTVCPSEPGRQLRVRVRTMRGPALKGMNTNGFGVTYFLTLSSRKRSGSNRCASSPQYGLCRCASIDENWILQTVSLRTSCRARRRVPGVRGHVQPLAVVAHDRRRRARVSVVERHAREQPQRPARGSAGHGQTAGAYSFSTARRYFIPRTSSNVGARTEPTVPITSARSRASTSGCIARQYAANVSSPAVCSASVREREREREKGRIPCRAPQA